MLEWLVMSFCAGTTMSNDACYQAWIKIRDSNDVVHQLNSGLDSKQKQLEKNYVEPLPDSVKTTGGAAGVIYKRQLKFGLTRNIYVDVQYKDEQRFLIGFKWSF